MTDREVGLKVLKSFYDYSGYEYPFARTYTFEELQKTLESRKGGKNIVSGLGLAVNLAEFDDNKIFKSMRALARSSGGKIPSKNGDFYAFMIDESTKVNFVDAVKYTAVESAKDVISGAQQVGDSLLSTGKILTWIFPVAVVYFGYQFLKNKTA